MTFEHLLFGLEGRINRGRYWAGFGLSVLGILIAAAVGVGLIGGGMGLLFFGLAMIPAVYVGVALAVKRLHDRDRSGWWALAIYLVPGALNALGETLGGVGGLAILAASFALSVWGFVELGCLRGTDGPNRFGDDPLSDSLVPARALR